MTAITHDAGTSTPDRAQARRAMVPVAVATAVVALFFQTTRSNSVGEFISMDIVAVVATVLIYAFVVRSGLGHENASVRALVMAVLGLLLALPVFWTGLPLVLGGAGALLGYAGKRASSRSGMCVAALIVGLLAVVAYLTIYVGDWIANPGFTSWSH